MLTPVLVALAIALALAAAGLAGRRRGLVIVAAAWLAYAGYEFLMYRRVLCSGECNIRVDLLLLFPLLAGATLWVLVAAGWAAWRRRQRAA